jgi:RNA polymerase sigma factor (sigma-70 family)
MNLYLTLLDKLEKGNNENQSIGIILCADKDHLDVEIALQDLNKPIGVAEYQLLIPKEQLRALLIKEINEDGDQLIDIIPNKNVESPDAILNSPEEIKKKVSLMLSILDEREKIIIEKYYGLTGTESNLDDLGEEFGCTKERIRQLRDKAIKKLRNESFGLLNYL